MRKIETHVVSGDTAGSGLEVLATDGPGPGGASHEYMLRYKAKGGASFFVPIWFQKGGIAEVGNNGFTNEALLAIVIDRLRSFQKGPFACAENKEALDHIERGLGWLHRRTKDRMARGVEGKEAK